MDTIERAGAGTARLEPAAERPRRTSARTLVAGRYRLGACLGRGASGTVWLAEDEELERPVAVKEVPRELARFPGATRAEARAAARVDHPAVVTVHDFVAQEGDDVDWIVMEALSGQSLASVLRRYGPLGADEVWYIAELLLGALGAVHAAGLVHGDVKPGNVQLCDDGRVVLLDFGLADTPRRTGGAAHFPIAGSVPYIAPEIVRSGSYSPRSDLYALGMTLYVAVAGAAPVVDLVEPTRTPVDVPAGYGPLGDVLRGLLDPEPATRLSAAAVLRARRLAA